MEENNPFLKSYREKLDGEQADPSTSTGAVQPAGQSSERAVAGQGTEPTSMTALHYEEKPTFAPPLAVTTPSSQVVRRRSKAVPMIILSVLLVAIIALLIWIFTRGTEVVDLTGWTQNDAQLWASDNNINLQTEPEFNDTVDAGKIISQSPTKGARLEKDGFLKVKISLGHDPNVTFPLPDLMSMTMSEVQAWADQNFMTRVRITTEFHPQILSGKVIRYEVNDDTVVDEVKRSSPVYVIVSKGPEPVTVEQVELPDFTTMSVIQAQQFAKDEDLVLKIIEQYDEQIPAGTILDQSIAAEEKVDPGTEIVLNVSKGKLVLVPDFSALSKEKAAATAGNLGINLAMKDRYSSRTAGRLISQSLPIGAVYTPGEVLELVYSLGNKIVLSSFVGQTRASIESWANDLNTQGASIRISVTQTQNNAPKDTILYQDKANVVIGPDTTIRITVSLGQMVFMPDLIAPAGSVYGQITTREKATAACETIGLIPVFVAETRSDRLPGEVWYQSIAPGKEIFEKTTVTLKYNPVNTTIPVPDFVGTSRDPIIAEGYLKLLTITFQPADAPEAGLPGTVLSQSIRAGEVVAVGTAITLVVNPEVEPTPVVTEAPSPTPTEPAEPSPTPPES